MWGGRDGDGNKNPMCIPFFVYLNYISIYLFKQIKLNQKG